VRAAVGSLRRAMGINVASFGADHPNVALSRFHLARALARGGHADDALQACLGRDR
jgi:hypothetical protein